MSITDNSPLFTRSVFFGSSIGPYHYNLVNVAIYTASIWYSFRVIHRHQARGMLHKYEIQIKAWLMTE